MPLAPLRSPPGGSSSSSSSAWPQQQQQQQQPQPREQEQQQQQQPQRQADACHPCSSTQPDDQRQKQPRVEPEQQQQQQQQQPQRRMGGYSIGEGAWRMVPLDQNRAYTFFVPFTTATLGPGVFGRLQDEAQADGVRIRLRGNKSSGHHAAPKEYRSLTVIGLNPDAVEHHVGQIFDAAVAADVDPDKIHLPDHWRHIVPRPLPKLPYPNLPASLAEPAAAAATEPGGCLSPLGTPRVAISFYSLGLRFMDQMGEYRELGAGAKGTVKNVAREGGRARDPGEEIVANAFGLLGRLHLKGVDSQLFSWTLAAIH